MPLKPFPWFSILRPDGTRPHSQTVPGFGEAIVVLTSEARLKKYRIDHQVLCPVIRFDSQVQLKSYLGAWSSVAGLLIDPESRDEFLVPLKDACAAK